jgi:hypothetical protein
MSITYNPITNFTDKDTMGNSNPAKVLSGVPFDAEFNAISAAFQLAAPSLNPTFTGTVTTQSLSVTGEATVGTLNGSDSSTWDATASVVGTNGPNWDSAYSWGDHGEEGYATEDWVLDKGYVTSGDVPNNTDTTYTAGLNLSLTGTQFSLDSTLVALTNVYTDSVTLGFWEINQNGDSLQILHKGIKKMEIDSSGNLTVAGNVTAYAPPGPR